VTLIVIIFFLELIFVLPIFFTVEGVFGFVFLQNTAWIMMRNRILCPILQKTIAMRKGPPPLLIAS
jgi:hypothetical protein